MYNVGSYCDQNDDGKKPKEKKAIKNSEIDERQPLKMRINLRNVIPPNARRDDIAKIIPSINRYLLFPQIMAQDIGYMILIHITSIYANNLK